MSSKAGVPGGELDYQVAGSGPPTVLGHHFRAVTAQGSLAKALVPHFTVHAVNPLACVAPDRCGATRTCPWWDSRTT